MRVAFVGLSIAGRAARRRVRPLIVLRARAPALALSAQSPCSPSFLSHYKAYRPVILFLVIKLRFLSEQRVCLPRQSFMQSRMGKHRIEAQFSWGVLATGWVIRAAFLGISSDKGFSFLLRSVIFFCSRNTHVKEMKP